MTAMIDLDTVDTTPAAAPAAYVYGATEAQRAYATDLGKAIVALYEAAPEDFPNGHVLIGQLRSTWGLAMADKREASRYIDGLKANLDAYRRIARDAAESRRAAAAPAVEVPEGMHKVGDTVYKVQRAVNGSGHLYAKRLTLTEYEEDGSTHYRGTFNYAPGAMRKLSEDTLMTLDEAKEFGALYGTCCKCGRTLTDEASIAAGIGPVCAAKGGWA